MLRPVEPVFSRTGSHITEAGNGWLEWEALLDKAEEDLTQCND